MTKVGPAVQHRSGQAGSAPRPPHAGRATARLFFWLSNPEANSLTWIPLASPGEFAVGDREKWLDALGTPERIQLTGQERTRITRKHHKEPLWAWR